MKIDFDTSGRNFIEMTKSGDEFFVTISASDPNNPQSSIVNSAGITKEQLGDLLKSIDMY